MDTELDYNNDFLNRNGEQGMAYGDGTGQWHTDYMSRTRTMEVAELQYRIKDCREAMEANPDNPKCQQYADEVSYCAMELKRREGEAA
tara:strand:+ start:348 stop:611 length:264 start_codon:yes stop_codon:yes gene_type:complete